MPPVSCCRCELTAEGARKKGSAEIKAMLGGRFITEDVELSFGDFNMDWYGVIGYATTASRSSTRASGSTTMNNTTQSGAGDADKTGRIFSFRGKQADNAKFLWRISNDSEKTMTIEMFQVAEDGKEWPVMKVVGKKQK
jgi:hypothetical protein